MDESSVARMPNGAAQALRARTGLGPMPARLVLSLFVVFAAVSVALNWRWPGLYVPDDAYFYLCVGRNLAAGNGSTFSGVTMTNGYHPLWQWCVAGIYRVVGDDDLTALRVVVLVDIALLLVSAVLLWRLALRFMPAAWAAVPPLLLALSATRFTYGLETWLYVALQLVLLLVTTHRAVSQRRPPVLAHPVLGVLAGAVILARLDSVLLIAAWFALVGWERWRRVGFGVALRGALIEGVFVSAVVVPYFVGNRRAFGHFTTISSTLKASFPQPTLIGLSDAGFLVTTLPGVVLGLLFLARARLWRQSDGPGLPRGMRLALQVAIAGMVLRTLAIYLFSNWKPYLASYWIDPVLVLCLLLPGLIREPARRIGRVLFESERMVETAALALLVAVPIVLHGYGFMNALRIGKYNTDEARALGKWYAEVVPDDAVVFQRDYVGEPTFWSRRRVLDGGGLMSDFAYQRALDEGWLVEYLLRHDVRYIIWDRTEVHPDAESLLEGAYRVARYPVSTVRNGREHGYTELKLKRQWQLGGYRFSKRGSGGTVEATQSFLLWRLPPGWEQATIESAR